MIKHHIQEKFVAVHFHAILVADKSETGAHLNEEVLKPVEQRFFECAFGGGFIKRRGFEDVGIFENLPCEIGLGDGSVSAKFDGALPNRLCNLVSS